MRSLLTAVLLATTLSSCTHGLDTVEITAEECRRLYIRVDEESMEVTGGY